LKKQIEKLEKDLKKVRDENDKDELNFMRDFKKVSQDFENNMNQYDNDVEMQIIEHQKALNDYNDAYKELEH
jgi:hypothetical protein